MTPTNQKPTQKTVFDLQKFDDIKLVKQYDVPQRPSTVEEALAVLGNDQSRLLDIVHKGLVAAAGDAAYNDPSGWQIEQEDGTLAPYNGSYADESKTKLINGAVLNLAKLSAGGSWDTLPKEQKSKLKDAAVEVLRSTPAILKNIIG